MGVATHRAESARHATDVIQSTTIHIAVVDLGLPFDAANSPSAADEAGTRVLELLRRLPNKPPSLVIKRSRTQREDAREMAAALRSGAFAVLDRPRATNDLELLLEALRRCLVRHYGGQWPGL
jgi:CheY-like chemotaxis protein